MINTKIAVIAAVYYEDKDIAKAVAYVNDKRHECINYNSLTGRLKPDDRVVLNTTAVDLGLGTGGYDFVLCNLSNDSQEITEGHIMKLKYTPVQFNCMSAEAQESSFHDIINGFSELDGMPVIAGSLHSVLAPSSICLKGMSPGLKIVYIMTDSGALPIYISDIVKSLKTDKFIEASITCGNAFGGDLECVNVYSAIIAAKEVFHADAAIICMGPGIVGTGTAYGFSGIEQGYIIDAINSLGGKAVAVPRISFSDRRERHYGISHHSITVLSRICNTGAYIAIPEYEESKISVIKSQIVNNGIDSKHKIIYVNTDNIERYLKENIKYLCKMGKGYDEDREYFLACGASAAALKHF
ncbi:MAG: DUF3866 family protein [Bacillota bacterium]